MSSTTGRYAFIVIGDWHLAFVTAACVASLGHRTLLVKPVVVERAAIEDFPEPPVTEPGLPEMIASARAKGTLEYANGFAPGWAGDVVWVAIDTPVNEHDEADTSSVVALAEAVARNGAATEMLAISSQIPLGFSTRLEASTGLKVAYVPENLRLGVAIANFLTADRTVIGAARRETAERLQELLRGFETEFLLCDLLTAEMIKHATNAFLATSISFANELARIGEAYGVDNQLVGRALKLDKRIGKQAYVSPGLGFAGGTLPRDLRTLQKLGSAQGMKTPLVDAVLEVNETTAEALVFALRQYLGDLRGAQILIVGYTYKAETDTLRRSPSLELATKLQREGATLWGFDPPMNVRDLAPLEGLVRHCRRWDEVDVRPDAIVIMTPRREFADLDWSALAGLPGGENTLLLDARAAIPPEAVRQAGFAYKALWQPPLKGVAR